MAGLDLLARMLAPMAPAPPDGPDAPRGRSIRIGDYVIGNMDEIMETLAAEHDPRRPTPADPDAVAALPRIVVGAKGPEAGEGGARADGFERQLAFPVPRGLRARRTGPATSGWVVAITGSSPAASPAAGATREGDVCHVCMDDFVVSEVRRHFAAAAPRGGVPGRAPAKDAAITPRRPLFAPRRGSFCFRAATPSTSNAWSPGCASRTPAPSAGTRCPRHPHARPLPLPRLRRAGTRNSASWPSRCVLATPSHARAFSAS